MLSLVFEGGGVLLPSFRGTGRWNFCRDQIALRRPWYFPTNMTYLVHGLIYAL